MTPTIRHDRVGAAYVWIPPGQDPARTAVHAPFLIMRTPVTNAMWSQAVAAGACRPPRTVLCYNNPAYADHPVVHVTRAQARAYAAWVGGRLPRDCEWTRAAQGDDGRQWPWGDEPPNATRANFDELVDDTTPVGSYPAGASAYGVLDMAGNVWEWVEPDDGSNLPYLFRGGSFLNASVTIRCDTRFAMATNDGSSYFIGLRVVRPRP